MVFRKDINGLRAIAVIAVVIYHFNPTWLPGGFAGVDVFFVISGYLMTAIVFSSLNKQKFSLLAFYKARAKRIIPPLSIVCITLLIFGWVFLPPIDFQILSKHIASSLGFFSNITYWTESGYFGAASGEKWLLHTWSLSAEWQFYILYPIFILAATKLFGIKSTKFIILAASIISLILCIGATYKWPNSAFYLLPTRAWELMSGGLVFLFPLKINKSNRVILELTGASLIVFSYIFISEDDHWPGYLAILPVLGAFLIIQSNRNNSILTNNLILQKIGSWSYSIYLWHWVVIVTANKYFSNISDVETILLMAASVLLGYISFTFIEKYKRDRINIAIYLITIISSIYVFSSGGASEVRYSTEIHNKLLKTSQAIGDWGYPDANTTINNTPIHEIKVNNTSKYNLFIGDSLIQHYYPKIKKLADEGKAGNTYFFTEGGCMPINLMHTAGKNCSRMVNAKKFIEEHNFNTVIISGAWFSYLSDDSNYQYTNNSETYYFNKLNDREVIKDELDKILRLLVKKSKRAFFILPTPNGEIFDPKTMQFNILNNNEKSEPFFNIQEFRMKYSEFFQYIEQSSSTIGYDLINPIDYLCKKNVCDTRKIDGTPYYMDNIHMRPWYVIERIDFFDDLKL